jgi:hypothetical protein
MTAVLAVVLTVGGAVPVSAGTTPDPNTGDTVLGKVGGLRYAMDSSAYDAGSHFGNTAVGCGGPAWQVIGGGSNGGGATNASWQVDDRPTQYPDTGGAPDDGWDLAGYGPASAHLTGFSICIRGAHLRYRSETVPDSSSGLRTASIACGGAAWHVAAGGAFIATSGSWINSSFPLDNADPNTTQDDGWTGRVYDTAGGFGGMSVEAICARGLTLRYVRRAPVRLVAGQTVSRRVACKPSEHVVGGGARVSGHADRARVAGTFPYDGPDAGSIPDDGWQSRIHATSGGGARKVTAFAICLGG